MANEDVGVCILRMAGAAVIRADGGGGGMETELSFNMQRPSSFY